MSNDTTTPGPDHRDLAEDRLEDFQRTGLADFNRQASVHALLAIYDVLTDLVNAVEDSNSVVIAEIVDAEIGDKK